MEKLPFFDGGTGVSDALIEKAEFMLNVRFSNDYKEYLRVHGTASVDGHELTGIHSSKRLNVVDVTLSEKKHKHDIPHDWYVVEQTHIDGIVIWQNEKGDIYQTCPGYPPLKIADSIIGYLYLNVE